jgi:hypothetical protein
MDEDGGLVQSFIRLGNEIVAERDRRASEGVRHLDIAFDLLAMVLRHYHEEYGPRWEIKSCLEGLLGAYPLAAHASPVPIEVVREWVLSRCDIELESVPYRIIDALRGEYLTFLWGTLRDLRAVPLPRGQDTDDQKVRSTLVGLGFSEPYRPRWGFNYICRELEIAQHALSDVDTLSVDSKTVEVIRDNAVLAFKCFKRFFQMLLSFYGQYLFGDVKHLLVALKPDVAHPHRYLENCRLQDYIELVSLLERSAKLIKGKPGENEPPIHIELAGRLSELAKVTDESWQEFSELIVIKRDLIDGVQQACENTVAQLKVDTRAAYTVEEVLTIKEYILEKFISHLLSENLRNQYRDSFPQVVALKVCRQDEDKQIRIDYIDETGSWGFIRKDIAFKPRSDFYFFRRPERSPVIIAVEDKHKNFIIRYDHPLQPQLDDRDLRTLFERFEKLRKVLEKSGQKIVIVQSPPLTVSPLEGLGIAVDGSITDRSKLLAAIQTGESQVVEFKATCRDPSRNHEIDRGMLAEEIAALANTRGGILVLGIPDKSKPKDIEKAQAMRQELGDPLPELWSETRGRRYILDTIAGVAKGTGRDARACSPAVEYAPHLLDAEEVVKYVPHLLDANDGRLEEERVLVVAIFPMGGDSLCWVNQKIYVRVGTSCRAADSPWIDEWYRTKKKLWL